MQRQRVGLGAVMTPLNGVKLRWQQPRRGVLFYLRYGVVLVGRVEFVIHTRRNAFDGIKQFLSVHNLSVFKGVKGPGPPKTVPVNKNVSIWLIDVYNSQHDSHNSPIINLLPLVAFVDNTHFVVLKTFGFLSNDTANIIREKAFVKYFDNKN